MHSPEILLDVLIFLAAAIAVVPLLLRFRIGLILGYLAAGMIIVPHALSLISTNSGAGMLAEFGIVFLLFMIGLELSVERLKALERNVFSFCSLQVIVSGILIGVVALFFSANGWEAIIIGGGLALSSTTFVLQLLIEHGERANSYGQTAFAILLLQVIAVVPLPSSSGCSPTPTLVLRKSHSFQPCKPLVRYSP